MRINHNIAALNTYRQLTINNVMTQRSLEKLSSGLRINRAGDDAAGLAISEKMRGQIRGLEQASRNAQDGISMIQTAEGALNEVHSILQRIRELAVQATNDTLTSDDRAEIQKEVDQLIDEIDRIATTTEFNTKKLLDGQAGDKVTITSGTSLTAARITGDVGNIDGIDVYDINVTAAAEKEIQVSKAMNADGTNPADLDAANLATAFGTIGPNDTITFSQNGKSITVDVEGTDTIEEFVNKVNDAAKAANMDFTLVYNPGDETASAGTGLSIQSNKYGTAYKVYVSENFSDADVTFGFADTNNGGNNNVQGNAAVDATVTVTNVNTGVSQAGITGSGLEVEFTASNTGSTGLQGVTITTAEGITGTSRIELEDNKLSFHIGANQDQTMTVGFNDMRSTAIGTGVTGIDASLTSIQALKTEDAMENVELAEDAITLIDRAIQDVSAERSKLGAYQNRLEHTINNLGTSAENLTASESRIRDVDMAKEMMEFTKMNILSQAAQAMLAQANQLPQGVLQLLR